MPLNTVLSHRTLPDYGPARARNLLRPFLPLASEMIFILLLVPARLSTPHPISPPRRVTIRIISVRRRRKVNRSRVRIGDLTVNA